MQDKLFEKLKSNYEQYERDLLSKPKEAIYENSYKTTILNEIMNYVEFEEIDNTTCEYLLELSNPLGWLYEEYLGNGSPNVYSVIESLFEYIQIFY